MRIRRSLPVGEQHAILPTAGCGAADCGAVARAGRPAAAMRRPDAGQVRFRIPRRPRLPPAGRRARLGRRHGRPAPGPPQSKYVARRETPVYIAGELHPVHGVHHRLSGHRPAQHRAGRRPPCSRPRSHNYVTDAGERAEARSANSPASSNAARAKMNEAVEAQGPTFPFKDIIREEVAALNGTVSGQAQGRVRRHHRRAPDRLQQGARPSSGRIEKKNPGEGGAVLDLRLRPLQGLRRMRRRCAATTTRCVMVPETEELNADLTTAQIFSRLLPDTPQKFLGLYDDDDAARTPARPRCATTSWCAATTRRSSPATAPAPAAARSRILRAARLGHRGLHAPALPPEGRPPPRQGRPARARKARRSSPRSKPRERRRIPALQARLRPRRHGARRRERRGHRPRALEAARPDLRRSRSSTALVRGDEAGRLQPPATCRPSTAASPTACPS